MLHYLRHGRPAEGRGTRPRLALRQGPGSVHSLLPGCPRVEGRGKREERQDRVLLGRPASPRPVDRGREGRRAGTAAGRGPPLGGGPRARALRRNERERERVVLDPRPRRPRDRALRGPPRRLTHLPDRGGSRQQRHYHEAEGPEVAPRQVENRSPGPGPDRLAGPGGQHDPAVDRAEARPRENIRRPRRPDDPAPPPPH